ncbi:unnamed protein product [Rotaria sp. Silwood1]|nr:unnamed protein product [Rotaria sp. Silwood1]
MDMDTSNLNEISKVENLTRLVFSGSKGIQFQFTATGLEGKITPSDIFFAIIGDNVIQLMVTETNRYANYMRNSKKFTQSKKTNQLTLRTLITLDGYIAYINSITKNNGNDHHHYSFIICLQDQSTVRVMNDREASINSLREQNGQYSFTMFTKLIEKVLSDTSGELEITLWKSHFNQVILETSYQIHLLKTRVYNDQISLVATSDTSEIDIAIDRYHILEGQIICIEYNDNHYACQDYETVNTIDESGVVSCNDCHC